MMNKSDFAEILTALFNGNAGQAEQTAENMEYREPTIEELWEQQRQENINYYVAYRKKMCYNKR